MKQVSIPEALEGWGHEDLQNLWVLLEGDGESPSLQAIESRFKWLYCSQVRANTESVARNVAGNLTAKLTRKDAPESVTADDLRPAPRYDELLVRACKTLKAYESDATLHELELFLSQAVIAGALHRMSPRERVAFFQAQVAVNDLAIEDPADSRRGTGHLAAPVTTLVALGVAQASGFGVYVASTTALGFLTHAVGVTLPFAVYTGMTSTIAFLIGPAGWLAASFWFAWAMTQPNANKLIGPVVYIAARNSRPSVQ